MKRANGQAQRRSTRIAEALLRGTTLKLLQFFATFTSVRCSALFAAGEVVEDRQG